MENWVRQRKGDNEEAIWLMGGQKETGASEAEAQLQ